MLLEKRSQTTTCPWTSSWAASVQAQEPAPVSAPWLVFSHSTRCPWNVMTFVMTQCLSLSLCRSLPLSLPLSLSFPHSPPLSLFFPPYCLLEKQLKNLDRSRARGERESRERGERERREREASERRERKRREREVREREAIYIQQVTIPSTTTRRPTGAL